MKEGSPSELWLYASAGKRLFEISSTVLMTYCFEACFGFDEARWF